MKEPIHIQTSDTESSSHILKQLYVPLERSHKGQNGKVLIIGGSSLFHASPLWAAEAASHFADMVHFASTHDNNLIFLHLKKLFRNGIIVPKKDIDEYAKEDDSILIGPGMERGEGEEGYYTKKVTRHLLETFPDKRFVLDAGAIQMMEPEWLVNHTDKVIITPHQLEFERLFGFPVLNKTLDEKIAIVQGKAKEFDCVILLKAVEDIVTDGEETYVIKGGNAGLTKGGTGDVIAGLTVSMYAHNEAVISAAAASVLLKSAADALYKDKGYWYTVDDLLEAVPRAARMLTQ